MRYYIADPHFGHGNLNLYMDKRGFADADAMDAYMIEKWNSRVGKKDEVVILGDFCISTKVPVVNELLAKLNGKKTLVVGNHDNFLQKRSFDSSIFEWVGHYREMHDNGRKVILSHYPIMCYDGQYRLKKDGTPRVYMLYGHVHNTFDEYLVNEHCKRIGSYKRSLRDAEGLVNIPCRMINCFCMFSDYVPLTLDEWIELDAKRRANIKIEDYEAEETSEI